MNLNRLKNQLEKDEGRRAKMYRCTAGKNTIAIGRNVDDNPIKPSEWEFILGDKELIFPNQFLINSLLDGHIGLSDKAIDHLFENDIKDCEKLLRTNFGWFEMLDDLRQEMIMNLCFQVGFRSLSGFRKMIGWIIQGDFENAGKEFKDSRYWRERKEKGYILRAERLLQHLIHGVS